MAAALFINVRKEKEFRHSAHIEDLNDAEMVERYRFNNEGIAFLCELLKDDLSRATKRNKALTPRNQILVALRFFASGSFYSVIGDTMGYHKCTVSRVVDNVVSALLTHLREFVTWPVGEEKERVRRGFFRMAGFPNVIGCIDGTHIEIQAPHEDEPSYVNRKGRHSINAQAVCDHEGKFTSINASWPGSCHDSHIFRASGLCARLEREHQSFRDGILLGDSGYACKKYLLTPFLVTDTQGKAKYQQAHTHTRVTIERTFGRLKRRFSVLTKTRLSPLKACRITTACVILHNICISLNQPEEDEQEVNNVQDVAPVAPAAQEDRGSHVRQFVVDRFFS